MQLFNTSQGFCAENNSLQNLASPRFYYFSFISEQLVRVFVHPLPSRPRREFGRKPLAATYALRATTAGGGGQRATLALGNGDKKNPHKLRAPSRQVKVQDAPLPVASSGKGREPEPSAQQTPAPHPCPFRRLLFFLFPSCLSLLIFNFFVLFFFSILLGFFGCVFFFILFPCAGGCSSEKIPAFV